MIYSNLWGLVLFGEHLTLLGSLGALLVAAGVMLATLASRKARGKPAAAAAEEGIGGGRCTQGAAAVGAGSKAPYVELAASAPSDTEAAADGKGAVRAEQV